MQHDITAPLNNKWRVRFVSFGLAITLAVTLFLVSEVIEKLERQRSASSDNLHWTFTQVEVDYWIFLNAFGKVINSQPDALVEDSKDIAKVWRTFDLFYSRVDTLDKSRVFDRLRQDKGFSEPLIKVLDFLNQAIPTIDDPDPYSLVSAQTLWEQTLEIRPVVRALSISGLDYFAEVSDETRLQTNVTLMRLAVLVSVFFIALAWLAFHLLRINRTMLARNDEILQTNHRMNTILSTSLDAVIVVNANGEVLEFNSAAETIFYRTFEEVKGKLLGDLIIPPHLRDAHNAGMRRMKKGGEKIFAGKGRVQLQGMRANGEQFPVEIALQAAFDGREEIFIGFMRDISKQVADEQELVEARDRALAGEKAKANFLTVMSHEIRTPLNGLLGNLSLLKSSNVKKDREKFIQNMEISGQILLSHVDTVLDIARAEAGNFSAVFEPVNLNDILQDLVDAQSGNAASRGNVIEWQWVGEAAPWVLTNAKQLQQILLNLVGNAIKFTQDGRITIELEIEDLDPAAEVNGYEFRVIDTGFGMEEEIAAKVFEDFYTHDVSFGRSAGGTGLGLGIARRFVNALGGEIGVESEPGQGSVFWVRIPLEAADANQQKLAETEDVDALRQLDLLVVEDNEINLEVICAMLRNEGHQVTTATDGITGVELARVKRYDAILMDISMPVLDGLSASRTIRAGNGLSSNSPILAVSANVLPEAVASFQEAGMNGFISKPLDPKALYATLAKVASNARAGEKTLKTSQIDTMKATMGEEAAMRLLNRFVVEAEVFLEQVQGDGQLEPSLDELAATAHKLAGSAAVFGVDPFRQTLLQIEVVAKAGESEKLPGLIHELQDIWAAIKSELPL